MIKFKSSWVLAVIFLLGLCLRFWQLGQVPVILNRDEAALGYNALLLKETGKDEWGQHWPVALQSFGDYKLIGYPLATVISFSLFGYFDWAVKLPSALAGSLLILVSYWGVKKLLHWRDSEALLLSFLIALQPVFFFYSRIAFEANVALTFFVGSLFFYFRPNSAQHTHQKVTNNWTQDLVGGVLLLVAIFTYNTPLLLLPFLILLLIWWRGMKQPRKWLFGAFSMSVVFMIGVTTLFSLTKQKSGITIFNDENTWLASVQYHQQFSGFEQKILGNKVAFYGRILLEHELQTFSPVFLVERGGSHPWHSLPGWGHFYWSTYILGLLGVVGIIWEILSAIQKHFSVWKDFNLKSKLLLLFLFLVSPIPSIVTVDAPHATRSLFFLWLWLIFSIAGLLYLQQLFKRFIRKPYLLVLLIIVLESGESLNYFNHYFRDYPAESNAILRGHYQETLQEVTQDQKVTKAAIIDDGGYQYILTAWYLKMSPARFFATVQKQLPDKIGFRYGYTLDKYRFIKQPADRFQDEKTLIEWNSTVGKWQRQDL